ncbi:MAG TPA: SDR family NAD(P)-dependent oxidoreductase [Spirochaetia bacterium]|nr:SDR family NAD(P)-dependent oxidoreductase [Spirochaetia bacterium]
MGSLKNGLVITGGASGIGAAAVKGALARGWPVAFCDVQTRDKIDPSLLTDRSLYIQADVTKPDDMACFRASTIRSFTERGLMPDKLNVVACAGISRRGDPVQVQLMKDINEGGTFNLLYYFANDIPVGRGLFVGLSSIVAAEGIAVQGDEEYKSTKAEAKRIATEEARGLGVEGFAVAPGAIDTPMTRHELVFGMLLMGAARIFGGNANHPLNKEVLALAGISACVAPAVALKGLLGRALTETEDFKIVAEAFEKDPLLSMMGVMRFVGYLNPKGADGQRHVRSEVIARSVEILRKLDVVIGPEVVARIMLDQFEKGKAPEGGLLKAYSANGEDRITQLMGAFAV